MSTRTTNRIHFSDLEPHRFGDLCYKLLDREHDWLELHHVGRSGNDGGVDILGRKADGTWFAQCKRTQSLFPKDVDDIVEALELREERPVGFFLLAACPVSRGSVDRLKRRLEERGILEYLIWDSTKLETLLYKSHQDLRHIYFDPKPRSVGRTREAIVKHALKMERRLEKALIDHAYVKERGNWEALHYEPWRRFISLEVIIHSIDDTDYPGGDPDRRERISPWFKTDFYSFYHNGIEFHLGSAMANFAQVHSDGTWEYLHHGDPRIDDLSIKKVRVKPIGRIPYSSIVEMKLGDEYYSEPHLYCRFDNNGMPYEKMYLKREGDPRKKVADWDMPEDRERGGPGTWLKW